MDGAVMVNPAVTDLRREELGFGGRKDRWKDDPALVARLGIDRKLPVHSGCVNSIVWSEDGSCILSASDDAHLVISDPFLYSPVVSRIRSGHTSNIFSARFLPATKNSLVISCASEGNVILTDVERSDTHGSFVYSCSGGSSIYEVCPLPHSAFCFMSCGEDGTVRLYDRRQKTNCTACRHGVIIDCKRSISAMDVNKVTPELMAIGCGDSIVRLYDMRYANRTLQQVEGATGSGLCCMPKFSPDRSRRVTSVDFDASGQFLLASVSCNDVCLFSLAECSSVHVDLCVSGGMSNEPVMPKRIRFRGDWSDTGPENIEETSIPNTQLEAPIQSADSGGEEPRDTIGGASAIVEHFGRVFNDWYQRRTSNATADNSDNANANDNSDNPPAQPEISIDLVSSGAQLSTARMQFHQPTPPPSDSSSEQNRTSTSDQAGEENRDARRGRMLQILAQEARRQREDRERQRIESLNRLPQRKCVACYSGHRNARTMMKQATFWGNNYIMSGSDCGHIIIWNRSNGHVVGALEADGHVVNCVQPHPTLPILASSGIDYDIKIWSPCVSEPVDNTGRIKKLLDRNNRMLNETMDTVSIPATFMFRMMAQMNRNRDQRRAAQRRAEREGNESTQN